MVSEAQKTFQEECDQFEELNHLFSRLPQKGREHTLALLRLEVERSNKTRSPAKSDGTNT